MSLRVGHIAYVNCEPFFHFLRETGFNGVIREGVPSELNAQLAAGHIDISPSSTFEYGCNWARYLLLPDLSISACGSVQSVLLFSPCPFEKLAGQPVALTGESATSINLLRLLCLEFYGFPLREAGCGASTVEEIVADGGAGLLIGDRALRAAERPKVPYVYDLGDLWWRHTGLPFVFAMWIVNQRIAEQNPRAVSACHDQLQKSLQLALADLDHLARHCEASAWLSTARLADYWRSMSYTFTDRHRQGLELFFRLAVKHRLLAELPRLKFFSTAF